jgi:hypothetical protein
VPQRRCELVQIGLADPRFQVSGGATAPSYEFRQGCVAGVSQCDLAQARVAIVAFAASPSSAF